MDVLQALKVAGVDVDGAMERFVQDRELYESCLKIFADDPDFENLGQAIEVKDYQRAFNAAHTLKGVSGNLGLTPLFDAVSQIVESLRCSTYVEIGVKYAQLMTEKMAIEKIIHFLP